tara:strand:+ start:980 stop:1252 length:273 start_codon:yes stop_codon:yes gene_type:complete
VSGSYVFILFKALLIIENSNSKHGYQKSRIIKYGETESFLAARSIKNIPKSSDNTYEPESPRYKTPKKLKRNNINKITDILIKRSLSNTK